MLRIVVFDGGLGGELVADYLADELGIVEIIREIDWQHTPYESYSDEEICEFARLAIEPYIGYAELIVLGGYASSLALEYLRQEFPGQAFVGMPIDYRYLQSVCRTHGSIMFMSSEVVLESSLWAQIQTYLAQFTLVAPDCSGWEWRLDCGRMTEEVLAMELGAYFELANPTAYRSDSLLSSARQSAHTVIGYRSKLGASEREQIIRFLGRSSQARPNLAFAAAGMDDFISPVPLGPDIQHSTSRPTAAESSQTSELERSFDIDPAWERFRPDTIVLLDTHFWAIREELQSLFGYGVRIIDFRKRLLHEVCTTLRLRGLDGDLACKF